MNRTSGLLVAVGLSVCVIAVGCTDSDTQPLSDSAGGSSAGASQAGGAGTSHSSAGDAGQSATNGGNSGQSEVSPPDAGAAGALLGGASSTSEAGASAQGPTSEAGAGGAAAALEPLAGYTLFATQDEVGFTTTELIDMAGNVVRTWDFGGVPPKLLPGGDLIGTVGVTDPGDDAITLQQVGWNGDVKWTFDNWEQVAGSYASRQHHDFQREGNPVGYYAPGQDFVANGSTLVLAHTLRTVPEIREDALDDDAIYELDGNGALKDTVWKGADHIAELGFDEDALEDIRTRTPGTTLEWLHGNSISLVGKNHWFDEGHTEFNPNNIIYSSRNASIVLVISRETGKVVWRIGPDFKDRPEAALGQFSGQHNPHMIPYGLPGAGNMIVFDNGGPSGYGGASNTYRYSHSWSRVVEFNPITMEVVWQYGAASGAENFSSPYISNTQRLPNGHTLITIGTSGHVIEVTPDNEVVWQYQYVPPTGLSPWLYRSYRIPPEWLPAGVNAAHGNYANWADLYPVATSSVN